MSRGPMTALLAVLALAGYQNRDKIGEIFNNMRNGNGAGAAGGSSPGWGGLGDLLGGASGGGLGGLLDGKGGLGDLLGGSSGGNILSGGLGGLLDQFRQNGLGQKAESWVGAGHNEEIGDQELHQALGEETLSELEQKTGLSRAEILRRLSEDLPRTVDALTPEGRIPAEPASGTGFTTRPSGAPQSI